MTNRIESSEEIARMLKKDNRELKRTASGVRGRASRLGKISSVVMPADRAGKEYKKNGKAISFNVDDILQTLQDSPTLKQVMVERLEQEYQHYSSAVSRTLEGVGDIMQKTIERVAAVINDITEVVNEQAVRIEQLESEVSQMRTTAMRMSSNKAQEIASKLELLKKELESEIIPVESTQIKPINVSNGIVVPKPLDLKKNRAPRVKHNETKEEIYEMVEGLEQRGLAVVSNVLRKHCPAAWQRIYGHSSKYWDKMDNFVTCYNEWKANRGKPTEEEQPSENPSPTPSEDLDLQVQ